MGYDFEVSDTVPATPHDVYQAWMTSEGHSAMTGADAVIDPAIGAAYEAWNGYITGRTLALEPDRRIVQTWRTSEFADTDPDSQIEVLLEPVERGTRLTIHHTNVPDDQTAYELGGWQDSYFDPMKEYFNQL
jgi:activator of HSP90 ATPase